MKRSIKIATVKIETHGMYALFAGLKHLPKNPHQGAILEGSCDSLLVSELLVHLLVRAVRALLYAHVDTKARRQCLLETYAHAQTNHSGQRAMGNRRRDLDDDGADGRKRGSRREDVNVRQVYDGQ
jgi:hypothetical protein